MATAAAAAEPTTTHTTGGGAADQAAITSAMSAAPAGLGANAMVVAMDPNGTMRTLRLGNNGFTCVPDDPNSPGPDPMCADRPAMEWLEVYIAHKTPPRDQIGFVYMLQGGSDASNTDPFASKPADGHWIATGPHIMVIGADPAFYATYPSGSNPDTTRPYVMWAGTPYQHLMAPVK
jgi:hypothetical protein